MNKLSFKTTTLIAAIGMTLMVGYGVTVLFINSFTNINLDVHPVRMRALDRLCLWAWWASIAVFFWGVFRYEGFLPKRDKWSKTIGIAILCIVTLHFTSDIYTGSHEESFLWNCMNILCLIIVYGGYVAALWWCYAKSATFSNGVTNSRSAAIRYIALGLCLLGCMALLFHIISDVAWLNSFVWLSRYATPWDMIPYYNTLYIGIAACVLIGLYDPSKEAE